jgi:3',5'-cyclic AMP phosphodiesterase CpdA
MNILENIRSYALKFFTLVFLFFLILYPPNLLQQNNEKANLKFIVIGDTRHRGFWESLYWKFWNENNVEKTRKLFNEIASRNPDLILHLGDLISSGSSESEWENFDIDNKPVIDKHIPYYSIFGNHEYFGIDAIAYINFYKRFPDLVGKKWYSFIREGVGFIMLNSNFSDLSSENTIRQRIWYYNEINQMENNRQIKYIIVCSHHPPFTNSTVVSPSDIIRNDYVPVFQKVKKAALFFSGHSHSYEKFYEGGKYFIVSGGGGGPRQELNIDKSTRTFNDRFEGPEIRFFHFCEVKVYNDYLEVKVIKLNDDGSFSVADEIRIPSR